MPNFTHTKCTTFIENNFVDLVIAIYNMQYGNTYSDLKEYWDDIRKGFKVTHPEEIYLFEWLYKKCLQPSQIIKYIFNIFLIFILI